MDKMIKFVLWAWWSLFYAGLPRPKTLEKWITKVARTRWPWARFEPYAWHNDDGRMWHVWFSDEPAYVETREIRVNAHIGRESKKIVGIDVYDETLAAEAGRGTSHERRTSEF